MTEQFKEYYFDPEFLVGNYGTIVDSVTGRECKHYLQKSGYVYVWIGRGKFHKKSVPLHRLVAIAWHGIEGYKSGLYVDHINTIRSDNRAENLRWVTPKENANNEQTKLNRRRVTEQ